MASMQQTPLGAFWEKVTGTAKSSAAAFRVPNGPLLAERWLQLLFGGKSYSKGELRICHPSQL